MLNAHISPSFSSFSRGKESARRCWPAAFFLLLLGFCTPVQAQSFRFTLRAEPDVITANGISTSSIFVQLPQSGGAISAAPVVRFATTAGAIESQAQLSGGVARVLLRSSSTPGTAIITAFIGNAREAITVEFTDSDHLAERYLEIASPYVAYGALPGVITSSGKTVLDFGDTHIESDTRLDVDLYSARIWAQGGVVLRSGKGAKAKELRGDRLFYDLRRRRGVIRRADLSLGPARQEFVGADFAAPPASEPPDPSLPTLAQPLPAKTDAAGPNSGQNAEAPADQTAPETLATHGDSLFLADPAPLTAPEGAERDAEPADGPPIAVKGVPEDDAPTANDLAPPLDDDAQAIKGFAPAINDVAPGVKAFAPGVEAFARGINGSTSGLEAFAPGLKGFTSGLKGFARGVNEPLMARANEKSGAEPPASPTLHFKLGAPLVPPANEWPATPGISLQAAQRAEIRFDSAQNPPNADAHETRAAALVTMPRPQKSGEGENAPSNPPAYAPLPADGGPTPRIVELPPPDFNVASGYWVAARRLRVFPRDKVQFERASIESRRRNRRCRR